MEARGFSTICLSSAYSITAAVNPPRAVFIDFPLGHTAGKRDDRAVQRGIMLDTLAALEDIREPGRIRPLRYRWADSDDWKESIMRPGRSGRAADDRTARTDEPQYQYEDDRRAAQRAGR